jgi:ABC-type branched-subunit amino acid transport system ATPase component
VDNVIVDDWVLQHGSSCNIRISAHGKRYLNMTKIERIFEKEKLEYANERVREAVRDRTIDIARTMMRRGADILLIMEAAGLTEREIMNLKDKSATA